MHIRLLNGLTLTINIIAMILEKRLTKRNVNVNFNFE